MLAGVDDVAGDDAVVQDLPLVIDVVQEQVERGDALGQAALDDVPVGGRDDARQQIVREDALGAFVAAVDGEGDALVEEGQVRLLLAPQQFLGRQPGQLLVQLPVRTARLRLAVEHLVEGVGQRVAGEQVRRGWVGTGATPKGHSNTGTMQPSEPCASPCNRSSRMRLTGRARPSSRAGGCGCAGCGWPVELDLGQLFDRAPERLLPGGVNQVEVRIERRRAGGSASSRRLSFL